uniref:Uncharacterized protein n=1 Tax=Panagrolaimus davidi TaxID=227884 RepID=A0A914Q0Q2_9BILA
MYQLLFLRFIPTTTKVPSPSITTTTVPLTSEFTTQLNNAQIALIQNLEKHSTTRFIHASTLNATTQPPTRLSTSLFFTTPLFSRSQSTQTFQQQPSQFFQQQSTTRFIPVTTTVASTTPLPSTRSHSTTTAVESSRFSNPQRNTTFQQSISSAVNQQTSSQILSSSPLTTKPTSSSAATERITIGTTNLPSTTTTSTLFIQPIEQTTQRRPFGRFVLSEAKAVDLKDLRNRTGILGKIIKQQKIFDEQIRDSTLTTRNLPFTTPGEDKLIVDKRLQKLDETVKRFRTATPPFGFQLVSSIPTKRPTRSTTQFLSTQLLGRNATAQGVVDRDLTNPSRTTSSPSTTTADRFRKFERILPKRILGNDFRQIVFPTTTSTRSTRSTTTNDSNLLIVDGQAFGDHFGKLYSKLLINFFDNYSIQFSSTT